MDAILSLFGQYGLLLVFTCVLLDQLGLPLPAYPVLVVSGSAAASGQLPLAAIAAAALLACFSADFTWYGLGTRKGARMLSVMSRAPFMSTARTVQLQVLSTRWGVPALLVARFVPGLACVVTVIAGHSRTPLRNFLLFDAAGAFIWAGSAVALGWTFGAV